MGVAKLRFLRGQESTAASEDFFALVNRNSQANHCQSKRISNGNTAEWSPIRSVIIRVIRKLKHATFLSHGRHPDVICLPI